jgi:hypothetical protein
MKRQLVTVSLMIAVAVAGTALAQRRTGSVQAESPFILTQAITYRIGKTQHAEATVSVRTAVKPNEKLGVEVLTCQITRPVTGDQKIGRRVTETKCIASWDIASDSNEAMQDFEVRATASSSSIGDMESVQTFKYKEMK